MNDDIWTTALAAWCRYYVSTEEFDRSLTTLRSSRTGDAIIDLDPFVRELSYANARNAHQSLIHELHDAGVDEHTSRQAKLRACDWGYDAQKRYLAALQGDER